MLTILERSSPRFVGFRVDGPVERARLREARGLLAERAEAHGPLGVLVHLRAPAGIEAGEAAGGVRGQLGALREVERWAVVGGAPWLGPALQVVGLLLPGKVRRFGDDELDAAWRWLEEVA